MPEFFDVVVVGAGPAGSATAIHLAGSGHRVALLDRACFPRPKACAEYASPPVADLLRRLHVFDALGPLAVKRLDGMRIRTPGGRWFSIEYHDAGTPRQSLALPRPALDAALVARARQVGTTVLEGHQVRDLLDDGQYRAITVRRPDGADETYRARLVVGADGGNSLVARALGLTASIRWPHRLGLVAHFASVSGLSESGEMHVGRHAYCGLAPQPGDLTNVGLVVRLDAARRFGGSTEAFFDDQLRRLPGIADRLAGARRVDRIRGVGPIAHRVRRASTDRALLVGDAAGFLDPFTGEGIHKALRGAELAAEVADQALRRDTLSAVSLGEYDRARRATFQAKDALCLMVQAFLAAPPLLEYAAWQLGRRDAERFVLGAALGDCRPARDALTPRFLWRLLRP